MNTDEPLTVLVTRVIKPGCEVEFEKTMREFLETVASFPGHLGMHMLRPVVEDGRGEYTIIVRFDSLASRIAFRSSEIFREWMARMDALSVGPAVVRELRALEGWAALAGATENPPRWKMAVTVWVGVTILSETYTLLLHPLIGAWPHPLAIPAITALTVATLTWIVLPWAMRRLRGWYFPGKRG
jgi:antibiotic biosynthesis monooxygenase (ABM) superfamily enzyme